MANFWDFQERLNKRPAGGGGVAEVPTPAAGGEPLTVSQLTAQIERALKDCLPPAVLVKGELSNFSFHRPSGHAYFTLKDATACIDCVMFKGDFARLKFQPEDGLETLASGRVGVYAQRGKYQLYVSRLEPLGQGALELAFRQLCAKLQAEGLFEPERKRPLPPYPQRIALLTSTQTAALQDMLKVLRRFPWIKLYVYNVPVQGDGSAEKIAAALADLSRSANRIGGVDLILLGRGGGSLEDLWEFNEEILARAIVASRIPVITGIGHEVDVSVADLVADYHAHTPTEAAQVAMAQWRTARDELDACALRLRREMHSRLQEARQRLLAIERHETFRRPLDRINAARQLLDDRHRVLCLAISNRIRQIQSRLHQLSGKLDQYRPATLLMRLRDRLAQRQQDLIRVTAMRLRLGEERLARLTARLRERHPRHAIRLGRQRLEGLSRQLHRAMSETHRRRRQQLEALSAQLNALGPEQVLKRGYTITLLKKGNVVVKSANQVRPGDRLLTRFADGTAESVVEDQRQLKLFE